MRKFKKTGVVIMVIMMFLCSMIVVHGLQAEPSGKVQQTKEIVQNEQQPADDFDDEVLFLSTATADMEGNYSETVVVDRLHEN